MPDLRRHKCLTEHIQPPRNKEPPSKERKLTIEQTTFSALFSVTAYTGFSDLIV